MKDRVKTGRPRLTSKHHDPEDLTPGRRTFVRRRVGEEYHPECLVSTVKHGGGKLQVYGVNKSWWSWNAQGCKWAIRCETLF